MKITKRKVLATIIIASALLFDLIITIIYKKYNSTLSYAEIMYYCTQIISSFFVISGVIIAVWQYYLSSKSMETDLAIRRVQRALDFTGYYKDNILIYYPIIRYIFNEAKISEIIKKIDGDKMNNFDAHELRMLFSDEDINKLKQIQYSQEFAQTVWKASLIYHPDNHSLIDINIISDSFSIISYVANLIDNLLNNMEFFALHFSHQLADESAAYQALHQSYLEIVYSLYYMIANRNTNTDPTSKYYANVIWLFKIWRARRQGNEYHKK